MQPFPHPYRVSARAVPEGDVELSGEGLGPIATAPPVEFGGPGDRWSPETLLLGAIADCFTLGFRAIASASKLDWSRLRCDVEGTLDRQEGKVRFTAFVVNAVLDVPAGARVEMAERILAKAETSCLITNSLSGATRLNARVDVAGG
jgi:organic hydroperoxide reductase OsmC/OhrA